VTRAGGTQATLEQIEAQFLALAGELRGVEARLARLEALREVVEAAEPVAATRGERGRSVEAKSSGGAWDAIPARVGRSLVVLGGAYLIRAITEGCIVPAGAGVALGLAYAVWWVAQADRAAAVGDRPGAFFHALTSALIALPLVWETTARFGLLAPWAAQLVLIAYLATGTIVARHRSLDAAAAVLVLGGLATAVALLAATHDLLAATCSLLAVALGMEILALESRWVELRWPAGLLLDAVTLLLVLLLARRSGLPEGYVALTPSAGVLLVLAVPALYLASLATRTLLGGRQVTLFEMTQTPLALLVGVGGAWRLLGLQGQSHGVLASALLVLGGLCYAAAFLFAERRAGQARNFYFYATAAGALTLVGAAASFAGVQLALAGCALSIVAALLGRQLERWTLALHGAIYLLATAIGTGLVRDSIAAFLPAAAPPRGGWPVALVLVPVSLVVYALVVGARRASPAWWNRLPQLLTALVAVAGAAGVLAHAAAGVLEGQISTDGAVRATIGTAVLAALVMVLALAGSRWALPELALLTYPMLAVGGLKLVGMDLRVGRPVTLFASFVIYGMVLSLAPRLVRKDREPAAADP
jgi:hypothetical protein